VSFNLALNAALAAMLRDRCSLPDVVAVTGFQQHEERRWPGMSCEWTEALVRIDYVTDAGEQDRYEYHGDMAQLIRYLTDEK